MACIADHGFACECAALKLASSPAENGRVLFCPQCARAYLGPNAPDDAPIVGITWARLELELGNRHVDRYVFDWLRAGVPADMRRTLTAEQPRAGRFRVADRAGAALGAVLALVLVLAVAKALAAAVLP